MKILFLDIDGCLNTHEPLCPEALCGRLHGDKVARLNRVLRETDARIVLSSAWRYLVYRKEMTVRGLDWLLRSHGVIAFRLAGITAPDTMMKDEMEWNGKGEWPLEKERGKQIANWISEWNGATWRNELEFPAVARHAVVDDLDLGISAVGHPFVQTDGKVGITDADADRLIELLNGK